MAILEDEFRINNNKYKHRSYVRLDRNSLFFFILLTKLNISKYRKFDRFTAYKFICVHNIHADLSRNVLLRRYFIFIFEKIEFWRKICGRVHEKAIRDWFEKKYSKFSTASITCMASQTLTGCFILTKDFARATKKWMNELLLDFRADILCDWLSINFEWKCYFGKFDTNSNVWPTFYMCVNPIMFGFKWIA